MKLFGRIGFALSPSFWVVAAILGFVNTHSFQGSLIWTCVIFISVLVHELGHALMALRFGLNPKIQLIAFGGVTRFESHQLGLFKQFCIVIMGPVFGLLLFVLSSFAIAFSVQKGLWITGPLKLLQVVNLFWTAMNLIPVLPLDGGQIAVLALSGFFKEKGRYYALWTGTLFSLVFSVVFFLYGMILFGSFFFLFAYQNYVDLKQEKQALPFKQRQDLLHEFRAAETLYQQGHIQAAQSSYEAFLIKAPKGPFKRQAQERLASMAYEKGDASIAYGLLLAEKMQLSKEALYLLHTIAFELKKYSLVAELSGRCFQASAQVDVAKRAAISYANLGKLSACIGWLESALTLGMDPSADLIAEPDFDEIRQRPAFAKWVRSHLS